MILDKDKTTYSLEWMDYYIINLILKVYSDHGGISSWLRPRKLLSLRIGHSYLSTVVGPTPITIRDIYINLHPNTSKHSNLHVEERDPALLTLAAGEPLAKGEREEPYLRLLQWRAQEAERPGHQHSVPYSDRDPFFGDGWFKGALKLSSPDSRYGGEDDDNQNLEWTQ